MKPPPEIIKRGHEPSDVRVRGFVIFLVLFIVVATLLNVLLWWLYGAMRRPMADVSPLIEQHPIPPDPVQQGSAAHPNSPAADLQKMRDEEDRILKSYGWVDQRQGIVRVPIDRAMQMLIEQKAQR